MAAAIFERLVDDLSKEPFMAEFKYLKSKSRFVLQKGDVRNTIAFTRWVNGLGFLIVTPEYEVRYESITKWIEKFSYKHASYLKYDYNVGYVGNMLNMIRDFKLELDGANYRALYPVIRDTIKYCASYVFTRYDSLEHYFEYDVLPKITGEEALPKDGADWILEYLAACKLVAPQMYPEFKRKIVAHIDEMYLYVNGRKIREGNVAKYDGRWDEIFDYLENTDIANLPKRGKKVTNRLP